MKKKNLALSFMCRAIILTSFLAMLSNTGNSQIKVQSDGKIGIGTSTPSDDIEIHTASIKFTYPEYGGGNTSYPIVLDRYYHNPRFCPDENHTGYLGRSGYFWYRIFADKMYYVYAPTEFSDKNLKKNIVPLENSLSKIIQLRGVRYDLDAEALGITAASSIDPVENSNHIGLIAQEVLEVLPEIVDKDSLGYSIQYTRLIPLLIEAVKEQNEMLLDLQEKISGIMDISDKSYTMKTTGNDPSSLTEAIQANEPYLGQNVPNPFSENTTIEYYLPSDVIKANFYVYDLQGKQIKNATLAERGFGEVVIYGNELQAGIYHYSIIADGKIIGMGKMVLTD
ncbi:MAG: tail fiber domain-containing protein [Bacteroidales bacterium]|jgi:hypothetical protein